MKYVLLIVFSIGVAFGWFWYSSQPTEPNAPVAFVGEDLTVDNDSDEMATSTAPVVEVIAENLSIPWEIVFLPDGELLVTERPGRVVLLESGQEFEIEGVRHRGEGGLLGATLHPNFTENNYLYLYQTTEESREVSNRILRYTLSNDSLIFDRVIIEDLPGALYHDGGRIAFGPDGYLYVTVGDALRPDEATSPKSLEGTTLRLTAEGESAPGNPFGTAVYSYGHRNAQGLTWDEAGNLWSSEHGRSGINSGFDEINLITPGDNYGWPNSQGDEVEAGTVGPKRHSTADITWAPGDLEYHQGSLYMPGLRGETLYEAVLDGTEIVEWHEHFIGEYGRLRSVRVGPDGLLYLLTSNRDGRGGNVDENDDKVIRINPSLLKRQQPNST